MAMNQFSPALLEVLDSANKINPVTPQGRPTIAANVMQQAGKPVQGLPSVLAQTQQAAPSVAENMQEQQFGQMLAKTQPQPPAMMAEGGIASLPMGDEDYDYEYADGGIIGYAGPDGSEVNLGGIAGIPTLTSAAKEAMGLFPRPDDTRLRAEGERLRELQTQRPTSAAEIKANEIARKEQEALYEKIKGRDTGLGELMSVLGGISRRTGPLEELEGYRTKRDTAAAKETEAARMFAQQQSLLEKKDYADKIGDVKASMELEQALLKIGEDYQKSMLPAATSAYSTKAQQVSSAADRAARAKEGEADRVARAKEGAANRAAEIEVRKMRDPLAQEFIDSWMAANPGKPLYEAVDAYRGAGKNISGKEAATRKQQLARLMQQTNDELKSDYRGYGRIKDPVEKAQYKLNRLKENAAIMGLELEDSELDPSAAPAPAPAGAGASALPPGFKLDTK